MNNFLRAVRVVLGASIAVTLVAAGADKPARSPATEVHITFSGVISHVFVPGHAARAVVLRGTPAAPHEGTLFLRKADIETTDVTLTCDGDGECRLPIDATAIRFVGGAAPPAVDPGGTFDAFVPHLRAITNGEFAAVRQDVLDEIPTKDSVMAGYLELPGGRMTATPYATRAQFSPDYEGRGMRDFAQTVLLSTRVVEPELEIWTASDGQWRTVTFKQRHLIELRLVNEPSVSADGHVDSSHFALNYGLAQSPITAQPRLISADSQSRIHSLRFDAQCSNTQWP
jgi:hypothetical protein